MLFRHLSVQLEFKTVFWSFLAFVNWKFINTTLYKKLLVGHSKKYIYYRVDLIKIKILTIPIYTKIIIKKVKKISVSFYLKYVFKLF